MVKVNLLSKGKGIKKKRNVFALVSGVLFGLVALYFLAQVVTVVVRYIVVNRKLAQVKRETESVSAQLLRNNEVLSRFILTKFILNEILDLRAKQFDYAAYLKQAQSLIPEGNQIARVDFQTVGFVDLTVLSNTSNDFAALERVLRGKDWTGTDFKSAAIGSVSRSDEGVYRTDLLFGIRRTNGNQ